MANRLAGETSPYLRQHKDNPVDWYPWGQEALERARREDKPILLSIGYAACHWCHVMAHESFENPETAQVMNDLFVNIKVDREERPDLDAIYMEAVQAFTGSGGWPLTVFLTPEGKPFYGGTYFPPTDRFGMPGFRRLLREIAAEYRNRREDVDTIGEHLISQLRQNPVKGSGRLPGPDALDQAFERLKARFDGVWGGFGSQPKFPQPMIGELLLRLSRRGPGDEALAMLETTLIQMASGGMYDQLGGGFHRYSVDRQWLVPHFEKMLYDNALLARLYLHAFQATGKPLYGRVVTETLDYTLRELRSPEGGFYASQDADSEGREGAFYVWTPAQVHEVLGSEEGRLACRFFGVTTAGNFEGENVLTRRVDVDALAAELRATTGELEQRAERARQALVARRATRPSPATDTKIIAGWNGLLLAALAEAGAALGREDYLEAAATSAGYLQHALVADGRLYRTSDPRPPRVEGFLQDYAFVVDGLLALYAATLEGRWLRLARQLAAAISARFWDDVEGAFFETGSDHEALVLRPRSLFDNAIPAGGSAAALVLARLAAIEGNDEYRRVAETSLGSIGETAARNPTGFAYWLCGLDFLTAPPRELAILGDPKTPGARALLATAHRIYLPNLVVVGQDGAEDSPLLAGREALRGHPTAYYCANFACFPPATDTTELARLLATP